MIANFNEIMKEIEKNEKQIKTEKEKLNALCESFSLKRQNADEINKVNNKITKLVLTGKFLRQNARHTFYTDYIPLVLEVLNKYNGKPYGEKTKEKIKSEIKEKYNIGFYLSESYGKVTGCIYYLNDNGFHCAGYDVEVKFSARYNDPQLLIDNKINARAEISSDTNYINDIKKQVQLLIKARKDAFIAAEKAKAAFNEYNNMLPEKLNGSNIDIKNMYHEYFDFSI